LTQDGSPPNFVMWRSCEKRTSRSSRLPLIINSGMRFHPSGTGTSFCNTRTSRRCPPVGGPTTPSSVRAAETGVCTDGSSCSTLPEMMPIAAAAAPMKAIEYNLGAASERGRSVRTVPGLKTGPGEGRASSPCSPDSCSYGYTLSLSTKKMNTSMAPATIPRLTATSIQLGK